MLNTIKNAFNNTKNAAMVKLMKSQLDKAPLPLEQKKMFLKLLDTNPDLLMKIAQETEAQVKQGKTQIAAGQSVMMKYQKELREAMM